VRAQNGKNYLPEYLTKFSQKLILLDDFIDIAFEDLIY
jgi:hypothetical protein